MSTLAVIGGGLAGTAAAEAAARKGFQVSLFERAKVLGGRCASMLDPQTGQWFDNGQHLLLGCCTEMLALNQRFGLDAFFEHKTAIPFAETGGKRWKFSPSPYLPGSLRYLPALLKNPLLSFREKIQMIFLLRKLSQPVRQTDKRNDLSEPFHFHSFLVPLVLSALSETPENIDPAALQFIVRKLFFSQRDAADVYIPKLPLRKIYHDAAAEKLQELGVELNLLHRVERLTTDGATIVNIQFPDGTRRTFDHYISAVPSFRFGQLADASEMDETFVHSLALDRFEPGAVTTVHLWLDQPILPKGQTFAALLGGPGQFVFEMVKGVNENPNDLKKDDSLFYYTVVISASHRLLSDSELTAQGALPLVERITEQLRQTFLRGHYGRDCANSAAANPADGGHRFPLVKHHRVTTYFDAVFSPSPAVYLHRPCAETPFSNLFLAGDWTQTGYPSTMEGAVRSGLNAVKQLESGK